MLKRLTLSSSSSPVLLIVLIKMAASHSHFGTDDGQTLQQKKPIDLCEEKKTQGDMSNKVEKKLNLAPCFASPSVVSIFRVPSTLITDMEKTEAYVPKKVSLGPYHQEFEKHLDTPMGDLKSRALRRMTTRFNKGNDENLMAFFNCARREMLNLNLQSTVRDSYEENIIGDEEALALMLILDGCFILEILRTLNGCHPIPGDGDYYESLFETYKIQYTGTDILLDILKLENQIPFMVLRKLLQWELSSADIDAQWKHLKTLCSELFTFCPFDCKKEGIGQWSWPQPDGVPHLLGLLHQFIVSPLSQNGEHASNIVSPHSHNGNDYVKVRDTDEETAMAGDIHRAIDLRNAGIKFKACKVGIADIHYDESDATICLPPITINESTEIIFRNLIAFEMCKPSEFNYVSRYVCLMDQLVDSEEDVALLRKKKIIKNNLGSDGEIAELFNGLSKGVTVNLVGAFHGLIEKVHKHYNNKIRVQLAELVNEYCSSPWKILGLLGGIALLLLSTLQTIFAILTLYK